MSSGKGNVITISCLFVDGCQMIIHFTNLHYNDVIMRAMASQITRLNFVYSSVYSDADLRKHQSSGSLAFVRGLHHKRPVTRGFFSVWWRHHEIILKRCYTVCKPGNVVIMLHQNYKLRDKNWPGENIYINMNLHKSMGSISYYFENIIVGKSRRNL